jgi:polyisoprenoid-binding protein YceI
MSIENGSYVLGPATATLTVKTGKAGAAAKAGHDLTIEVTDWEATLQVAGELASSSVTLTADSRSLRVREGHGGMQALGDDDKEGISQTIDEEVLKGTTIAFRSTAVAAGPDGTLSVSGELELGGQTNPITFALALGDGGKLTGSTIVKQSDWGIKPYSALFGTLKVVDEVEVIVDAQLPSR